MGTAPARAKRRGGGTGRPGPWPQRAARRRGAGHEYEAHWSGTTARPAKGPEQDAQQFPPAPSGPAPPPRLQPGEGVSAFPRRQNPNRPAASKTAFGDGTAAPAPPPANSTPARTVASTRAWGTGTTRLRVAASKLARRPAEARTPRRAKRRLSRARARPRRSFRVGVGQRSSRAAASGVFPARSHRTAAARYLFGRRRNSSSRTARSNGRSRVWFSGISGCFSALALEDNWRLAAVTLRAAGPSS
jgi:hypothetical protein